VSMVLGASIILFNRLFGLLGLKPKHLNYISDMSMYDDYVAHFKKYSQLYGPKTAIFLQVGKFFEFYDILDPDPQTTCKEIADLLAIKLLNKGPTGREGLWSGIPTQSLHTFAMRLTLQGWTCVLFEESKDLRGKITRHMTRILSPGTHLETADSMESMFLATVWLQEELWKPPTFGASALDLTTGQSVSYQGTAVGRTDTWSADDLLQFFQVYPPRECVVYWSGQALTAPEEGFLRSRLALPTTAIHIKPAPSIATPDDTFMRIFKPKTLLPIREYLHLQAAPLCVNSLASLLRFVDEHFPSFQEHLPKHGLWIPEESVYLGNNVLTQINFLDVLNLFMKTNTQMGRRAMRQRLLYPIRSIQTLESRLEEITKISQLPKEKKQQIASLLQKISDLPRIHRKIQTFKVTAADVLALEQSYVYTKKLLELLGGEQVDEYIKAFKSTFSTEKACRSNEDLFFLPDDKGPETAAAEKVLATLNSEADAILEKVRAWSSLPEAALKLEGYTVTGSKTTLQKIKTRLSHSTMTPAPYPGITVTDRKSGGNLNIPALEEVHTKIMRLREEIQGLFERELPPVCSAFADSSFETWSFIEDWLAALDVTVTLERVCTERGFVRPELVDGSTGNIDIEGLRHPLIEAQATRLEYVKHSVTLDANGWLLYGMNASGKSSLMKSVGIAVLLAQCGCFVPATRLRLSPYGSVFTRILNHDNLWAGLSSFAVEMTELREILLKVDGKSLVLGDEVCSGTESTSATSLVAAALTWLKDKQASFLFATHLHGLMSLKAVTDAVQVWHLRVRYDPKTGVLTYDRSLQKGAGSSMYGLEVARALNLPFEFLEKAQAFRHELLGTAPEDSEQTQSSWKVQRRSCELCQHPLVSDIEIHHIRPQKEAGETGHFADGTHKDHMRNLIAVCQTCHDKHHAGLLEIQPVKQTSEGPVRVSEQKEGQDVKVIKSKWTVEQQATIINLLKQKPTAPLQRLLFELDEYHGIKMSSSTLQKIRKVGKM